MSSIVHSMLESFPLPSEDWTPEDWAIFRKREGVFKSIEAALKDATEVGLSIGVTFRKLGGGKNVTVNGNYDALPEAYK